MTDAERIAEIRDEGALRLWIYGAGQSRAEWDNLDEVGKEIVRRKYDCVVAPAIAALTAEVERLEENLAEAVGLLEMAHGELCAAGGNRLLAATRILHWLTTLECAQGDDTTTPGTD